MSTRTLSSINETDVKLNISNIELADDIYLSQNNLNNDDIFKMSAISEVSDYDEENISLLNSPSLDYSNNLFERKKAKKNDILGSIDVESLAEKAHQRLKADREAHSDWNSVNRFLHQRTSNKIDTWEQCILKFIGRLHICAKLLLLIWAIYSLLYQCIFILDSYIKILVHTSSLIIILLLILMNFYKCWSLDNSIPDAWVPPSEIHDGGRCVFCKRIRPMRSHHCVACGCCQLKRDHHCYWVSNCIGVFNYPYFMSLQLYDIIFVAYVIALTYEHAENAILYHDEEHPINLISLCVIAIIIFPMLVCYFLAHIYLLLTGHTSHECINGFGRFHQNPYDLNMLANYQQIFGKNPLAIFWPFLAPLPMKDFIFNLNDKADEYFIKARTIDNRMNSIHVLEEDKLN